MPQMMPLSWLLLFILFSFLLLLFNILNFYTSNKLPLIKLQTKLMVKTLIWKW
nr:ATP synthase F0 subunit 8 [Miromantis yunnanensis]